MRDDDKKSKRQLVSELEALRGRVAELEAAGSVGELHERTAELARASEQLTMFRRFAEASGQGFSMADLDGRLIYLNPALCRMLGDDGPEGRLGQHLSVCYPEEGNRRGREEIEPALEQNGYWEGELPLLSRQGQHVPTWQNSFVIRDDRGNPLRLAVVITDITERRRAATERARLEAELRQAQKMEAIGQLAGGVAHDFNNILTAISGYTEFAIEQLDRGSPAVADLEQVAKAAGKATALTRQLLAFSRQQVTESRPVNLNAVVRDMEKMLRRVIGEDLDDAAGLDAAVGTSRHHPAQFLAEGFETGDPALDRRQMLPILMPKPLNAISSRSLLCTWLA